MNKLSFVLLIQRIFLKFSNYVFMYPKLTLTGLILVSFLIHSSLFVYCPIYGRDESIVLEMGRVGILGNNTNWCYHYFWDGTLPITLFQSGSRIYWILFSIWRCLPRFFSFVLLNFSALLLWRFCSNEFSSSRIGLLGVVFFLFDPYLGNSVQIARCDILAIFIFLCELLLLQQIKMKNCSLKTGIVVFVGVVLLSWTMLLVWITSAFYVLVLIPYAYICCKKLFIEPVSQTFSFYKIFLTSIISIVSSFLFLYILIKILCPNQEIMRIVYAVTAFVQNEQYVNPGGNPILDYLDLGFKNYIIYIFPILFSWLIKRQYFLWEVVFFLTISLCVLCTSIYYARLAYICPIGVFAIVSIFASAKRWQRHILLFFCLIGMLIAFRYSLAGKFVKSIKYRENYSTEYLYLGFKDIPISKVIIWEKDGILFPIGIYYNWKFYHQVLDLNNQFYLDKYKIDWAVIPSENEQSAFLKKNGFQITKTIVAPIVNGKKNFNGSWQIWHRSFLMQEQ